MTYHRRLLNTGDTGNMSQIGQVLLELRKYRHTGVPVDAQIDTCICGCVSMCVYVLEHA